MDKIHVIDIGTNTVRALYGELKNNKINTIYKKMIPVRLGKMVDSKKTLSKEGIDRTVKALATLISEARGEESVGFKVIATSAVRDAANRKEFIDAVREHLGINIEILSGTKEAELSFLGVASQISNGNQRLAVMDIGGGSTEFAYGWADKVHHSTSIDIGSVRLTERFKEDILAIDKYINAMLDKNSSEIKKPFDILAGVGGTATTYAAIYKRIDKYDGSLVNGTYMELKDISEITKMLRELSTTQRAKVIGMAPGREDIIIAGGRILENSINFLGAKGITVYDCDLLEGTAKKILTSNFPIKKHFNT